MLNKIARWRSQAGKALLMLLCILASVNGQDFEHRQPANPDSALANILGQLHGAPLSLADAQQKALQNNAPLRQAEAVRNAANATVRREKGVFDPELFVSFTHQDDNQPTASFFSGASVLETQQTTTRGGLRWQLPTGTEFEAAANNVRLKTNSGFAFLNPQYTAFGSLTVRQSLLSGLWRSGRKSLSQAERERDAAQARYNQAVADAEANVALKYWDLYAAERDFAVQQLVRDRANALLSEAVVRSKAGLVGPNQVANARVFLAEQELAVIDREEQLDQISDELASLIGERPTGDQRRYRAMDRPPGNFQLADVNDMLNEAFSRNLGLQAAQKDIESLKVLSRAAGWEALPSVDLVGTLGGNGLSGSAQNVVFGGDTLRTTRSGTNGDALSEAIKREFPSWSVGVEIRIPIGMRSGRAERDRLKAQVVQSQERYIALKRDLEDRVLASYRELAHGAQRVEFARSGVAAAQEQVRIGMIEYRNGRATAFELVRLAADLALSQQRYSQALVRNAKAAATLKQLTAGAYPASFDNR